MTAASIRAWSFVHTWTSLICTLFMLLLCLTGLPLIFHHEIDDWFGSMTEASPATGEKAPESRIIARALADHPGKVVQYVGWDTHEPDHVYVILHDSPAGDPNASTSKVYDVRTAAPLGEPGSAFMRVMLRLHVDMFAGLPGTLFLGAMGLLLVAAIVSGVVLYWPFTRRLDFGTIRPRRSRRVAWLDLHNLLGIVTVAWLVVVGFTGSINTLAQPLIGYWKQAELGAMIAAHAGRPAPARLAPFDAMLARARAHAPGMAPGFVAFPGTPFTTGHHFAVFLRGDTPLTSRLLRPVLLDGETGAVADARGLPWYLTALLVSQPLHFGDYGGLPLKIIWALLDVVSLVVLGSGLYLWWTRRARGGAPAGAALPEAARA
ncbi:PepSY-associated TM helix domain-containing protein [Methylobacterium oryzihabitans]|uniref:PepSY domain-containing protein n=1 Tax=Methylobacterium oryzihabitans TaxID=2499852 RepID=A0A437P020_9HYPH|nr:PepSY-associated TM helix domain-containing protein [Methylobacterium oryzihabitans]RVU15468.1 PepSY domain-containing protein [Methylobacterium oryzihabitans]